MAKFAFPMTFEQFKSVINTNAADVLKRLANSETRDEAIEFTFSCVKQGWMSKQYHKQSQGTRQEENRLVREYLKKNPDMKAKLMGMDQKKGTVS